MSTKRYKKSSHHRAKTHRTRDEIEAELEMARKAREESAANNVEGGDNGSSSEEEDSESKRKGVQGLLETGNLNRDNSIKADDDDEPRLTRKEREALEKKKAKERYLKAYVEGRTPEAKSDLARLQKILSLIHISEPTRPY
eukprot:TRINITY_DN8177_c0_g1_i4.p1 TRINITY_DN8177_c0_g1~~TRINITY_DN8177_c0_g1_i4.p1  ORF type:complete len:141 (-),score=32.59 TRINITY_DN8177_c0_g1_i4:18-440(-)